MLFTLVKLFISVFGFGVAWAIVVCIFAVNSDRPDRDRRLREEGYDSCVNDILNMHQYWDREKKKYIDIEIKTDAQLKRKRGKWIRNDNGTYSCSLCQSWIPEEQHYYAQYCLYCGADMRSNDNCDAKMDGKEGGKR